MYQSHVFNEIYAMVYDIFYDENSTTSKALIERLLENSIKRVMFQLYPKLALLDKSWVGINVFPFHGDLPLEEIFFLEVRSALSRSKHKELYSLTDNERGGYRKYELGDYRSILKGTSNPNLIWDFKLLFCNFHTIKSFETTIQPAKESHFKRVSNCIPQGHRIWSLCLC